MTIYGVYQVHTWYTPVILLHKYIPEIPGIYLVRLACDWFSGKFVYTWYILGTYLWNIFCIYLVYALYIPENFKSCNLSIGMQWPTYFGL